MPKLKVQSYKNGVINTPFIINDKEYEIAKFGLRQSGGLKALKAELMELTLPDNTIDFKKIRIDFSGENLFLLLDILSNQKLVLKFFSLILTKKGVKWTVENQPITEGDLLEHNLSYDEMIGVLKHFFVSNRNSIALVKSAFAPIVSFYKVTMARVDKATEGLMNFGSALGTISGTLLQTITPSEQKPT